MVHYGERGQRQPTVVGHSGKGCSRHGPRRYAATAVGDGSSSAYIRGDGGRHPSHPCL
jgi:hypothetical protein